MTAITKHRFSVPALVISLLLATCSCTPSLKKPADPTSTSPPYQLPQNIQWSEHWAATPAADLMSPDGTFIRAYTEADEVRTAVSHGGWGSYPGFATAAGHAGLLSGEASGDQFGYATRWIQSLGESSNSSVTAVICALSTISATPQKPPAPYLTMLTLTYRREGNLPPANQRGNQRAPATSVFGDWIATDYKFEHADHGRVLAPCLSDQPSIESGPVSTPGWPGAEGK